MKRYPFLAIHPTPGLEMKVLINITDVTMSEFDTKWHKEQDAVIVSFGGDMPFHMNDDMCAHEDITIRSIVDRDKGAFVQDMTYGEYIKLIKLEIAQR